VRVICKKYRLRGESNFPSHLSGEENFSCPRNRYFSQITLTNRIYLFNSVEYLTVSKTVACKQHCRLELRNHPVFLMFKVPNCQFSIWFLFLINKYSSKSKLFHFLSGTIFVRDFFFINFTLLVYHCAKLYCSQWCNIFLMHSRVKTIFWKHRGFRINTVLVY